MSYLIPSRCSLNHTEALSEMSNPESTYTHLLALADEPSKKAQREHLSYLPKSIQQTWLHHVQILSEDKNHVSLNKLQEAVRRTALDLFNSLDQNGQDAVRGAIEDNSFSMIGESSTSAIPGIFGNLSSDLLQSLNQYRTPLDFEEQSDSGSDLIDNPQYLLPAMHRVFGSLTPECLRILDEWSIAGAPEEQRAVARLRILECSIDNLYDCTLDLSNLHLKSLPSCLEGLQHVASISLKHNELTEFPEQLLELSQLKSINLSDNPISSIPATIVSLQNLRSLVLKRTKLTWIPAEIGKLSRLEELRVARTITLESLPTELLQLQRGCRVDVSGCGLSKQICQRIKQLTHAQGYQGPNIFFLEEDVPEKQSEELRPLSALISELFVVAGEVEVAFSHLDELEPRYKARIQSWLSRLSETADYGRRSTLRQAFAKQILYYLHLANRDEPFRRQFLTLLFKAARTCGDRIALSILHIGAVAKRAELKKAVDENNPHSLLPLYRFLIHTMLPLDLLEKIARAKTKLLPLVDELQIYLAFPIVLRNRLKLDIDVKQMRFLDNVMEKPNRLGLRSKDFDEAERLVQRKKMSINEHCAFLAKNDDWKKAIRITHPVHCQKLEGQNYAGLEEAGENMDRLAWLNVHQEMRWGALTKQILKELVLS